MADSEATPLTASPALSDANQDEVSRLLLGFLQCQRDSVLKVVEGLPEEAWQTPVVPSAWTGPGWFWHLGGVEHHWLQHVTTGVMDERSADEEAGDEEEGKLGAQLAHAACVLDDRTPLADEAELEATAWDAVDGAE
jgi:uncharacterized damage-inducible protein DinB